MTFHKDKTAMPGDGTNVHLVARARITYVNLQIYVYIQYELHVIKIS